VADIGNSRVQKLDPGGGFLVAWGASGTGPGQFDSPMGVAVDATRVYVTDYGNAHQVQAFDHQGRWNWTLQVPGRLRQPVGVAAYGGSLFVSDWEDSSVSKFSALTGQLQATLYGALGSDALFKLPTGEWAGLLMIMR